MDILSEKYNSNGNQSGLFSVVLHKLQDIVRGLVGFFTLTEEERSQAGIYNDGEGRGG